MDLLTCESFANGIVVLLRGLNVNSKEVERGRYVTEGYGNLCFNEKESCNVWTNYIERIMKEENYWDHNVKGDAL